MRFILQVFRLSDGPQELEPKPKNRCLKTYMPHIVLETTADLVENGHIPDILEALANRLCGLDSISPADVKAYHTLRPVWVMGEGGKPGFAHCTVKVMTGRAQELKEAIADAMFDEMKRQFSSSTEAGEAGLTLELHEMERATYRKG